MNALIRQIAALSVLWAICEMLLPGRKYQQMVRMTAGLLVMASLASTVFSWLDKSPEAQPVMTVRFRQNAQESYQRAALTAAANQMRSLCERLADRAGYQASATVYLRMDGSVEYVQLTLKAKPQVLIPADELKKRLAQQLGVEEECIRFSMEET